MVTQLIEGFRAVLLTGKRVRKFVKRDVLVISLTLSTQSDIFGGVVSLREAVGTKL